MNKPMIHEGWTFFQASFRPVMGPDRRPTGDQYSIFSVRYDPAWPVVYGGSGLIIVGIFLQFYMRAGVFTDGGKRERERALRKQAKAEGVATAPPEPASDDELL
jgi:hypothetical protein